MWSFFAGVLTVLLVINCLLLILLILMQLPKKDAGAGVAFGGAAADALFGAGSGNFLTQTTRYATIALFVLALVLGYAENQVQSTTSATEFEKAVQEKQTQIPVTTPTPTAPAGFPASTPTPTNGLILPPVAPATTAAPAARSAASSNAPAKPTQPK